jgi:hypothetical protein
VVPDLEHIDVAQRPVGGKRLEDDLLGIARQERQEPVALDFQHHAGFVGGCILDRRAWPHRRQGQAACVQHVSGLDLVDLLLADKIGRLSPDRRVRAARSSRKAHHLRGDQPIECPQPSVVVVVQMRDDHRIQTPNPGPPQSASQRRLTGSGIDQHRACAVAHQNRVALADVERHDLRTGANRRPDCQREHPRSQRHKQEPGPRFGRRRPQRPDDRGRSPACERTGP